MDKYNHFLLTLSYNGNNYCGFQYQENGPSVQAAIERSLQKVFCEEIRARGASRTDAGVHAHGQRVQIQAKNTGIPIDKLRWILNRSLPVDIMIKEMHQVSESFHCIHDAISKTYEYQILNQEDGDPFSSQFSWHIRNPLNVEKMRKASEYFIGEHDFSAFRASGHQTKTSVRKIFSSELTQDRHRLKFTINGNGFLYHMVRNIVGTLVEIGKNKYPPEDIYRIIESKNREEAGPTAPPHGLFLKEIFYPEKSFTLQNNREVL